MNARPSRIGTFTEAPESIATVTASRRKRPSITGPADTDETLVAAMKVSMSTDRRQARVLLDEEQPVLLTTVLYTACDSSSVL